MFDATPIRPSWGRSVEAVRLALLAERARPIAASRTQLLPVLASLQDLLPEGGLRRATTIGIAADNAGGATTLALALIAGASGAGRWCVVKRIVDGQPWISMEDLVRTAGASRAQLESLATSGALRFLPEHANVNGRRALMWTAGAEAPELPEPSAFEDVADDLWSLGMTPDGTAVELIRPELKERGVVPAADLSVLSSERRVSVAGVVTHRQQPESARGAVFLNLEDETGMVNVIFSKGAWVRWRSVARSSPALIVRGALECADGAIAVVAERIEKLELGAVPGSRDFR